MLCEWRIHKKGAFPTIFCLKINHGGAFTPPLKIRYKGGKEPKNDLDNGIKKLSSDQDVLQMLKYVEKYKVIDLYVDPSITKESLNVDESLLVNKLDNDLFIGNQELGNNDEDVIEDKVICKSDGPLTPNTSKVLNKIIKEAGQLKIDWNGGNLYQATTPWGDQCVDMAANREETAIPESYCHQVHWLSTWKDMYRFKVNPCNGPDFWEKSTVPTTIIPPKINPQIAELERALLVASVRGLAIIKGNAQMMLLHNWQSSDTAVITSSHASPTKLIKENARRMSST
ncbi:hypothetical protein Tco_0264384 [Tanacetum coccineum]